jgi:hypothetical protein
LFLNLKKPLLVNQNSKILEYAGHQIGPNDSGSQNFSCLGFMVFAVGVADNFIHGGGGA